MLVFRQHTQIEDGPANNEVEKVNETNSENNIEQVVDLIDLGDYEKAKLLLLDKVNASKQEERVYNLLGYVERQLQNFASAIKYYQKCIINQ